MGKRFRTDHLDRGLLLPPSLHDWLPEGHLARFIADVIEKLDLGAVYRAHAGDGRGLSADQPSMIVRLLLLLSMLAGGAIPSCSPTTTKVGGSADE